MSFTRFLNFVPYSFSCLCKVRGLIANFLAIRERLGSPSLSDSATALRSEVSVSSSGGISSRVRSRYRFMIAIEPFVRRGNLAFEELTLDNKVITGIAE